MSYSRRIILIQLVFLLYVIKTKLSLLRCAMRIRKNYFQKNIAWTITIMMEHTPIETLPITGTKRYYKEFQKIISCMEEAFRSLRTFYEQFLRLHVIIWIVGTSVILYYSVIDRGALRFMYFSLWNTLLNVLPVILCAQIRNQFENVQNQMNQMYWSSNHKRVDSSSLSLRRWLLKCGHTDREFECGYFAIDMRLLSTLFDFVTLFIFAMIT